MELLWWVMDYFKVLPTEERFLRLTTSQVLLLAEMKRHEIKKQEQQAHPEKEEFFNPEYEAWEREELERLKAKASQGTPPSKGWVEL